MEIGKATARKAFIAAVVLGVVISCVGCSPKGAIEDQDSRQMQSDRTTQSAWSMSGDCAVCHTSEKESMTSEGTGACIHAAQTKVTCVSCHTDEAVLTEVHEKAGATDAMPKKLSETTVSTKACQNSECHTLPQEEFAALTVGVAPPADENGKTVNPHEVIGLTLSHEDITCSDCHSEHAAKKDVDAKELCLSCHHANVFECNTCH